MPTTEVVFYQDEGGCSPVVEWLESLRQKDRKGFAKCVVRIRRLAEVGHELRRPEAAPLGNGLYELRAWQGRVNYRILYFFHGKDAVVLTHGLTKEDVVPEAEIQRAIRRKERFQRDPEKHIYKEDTDIG